MIAFTMTVAGVFSQWAPQMAQNTMEDTGEQRRQVLNCVDSRINVNSAVQRGDNEVSVTFQVKGDQELDDFTLTFASNENSNIEQKRLENQNLSNNAIKTTTVDTPDAGPRFSQVEVASEQCAKRSAEEISLSCPSGFAGIDEYGGYCIMKYEASRSDATASSQGSSTVAASQQGVVPWANVNYPSARNACQAMGTGYNLTTNKQWQAATEAVIGQPSTFIHGNNGLEGDTGDGVVDPSNNNRVLTGTGPNSWATSSGVYDLNGNVWEYVYVTSGDADGTVDQSHPIHFGGNSDFVNGWNHSGEYPSDLSSSANSSFGYDHYWSISDDNRAVLRGGSWYREGEAGPFSMYLSNGPSESYDTVGFRCSY